MQKKAVELRQKRGRLIEDAKRIQSDARSAGRDLTDMECGQVASLLDEADAIERQVCELEGNVPPQHVDDDVERRLDAAYGGLSKTQGSRLTGCNRAFAKAGEGSLGCGYVDVAGGGVAEQTAWQDLRTGERVPVLGYHDSFLSVPSVQRECHGLDVDPGSLSVGRFLCARLLGDWRHAPVEASLTSSSSAGGTFLLPNPLSSMVVDAALAQTVLRQAGAMVVPMTSNTLDIVKVLTLPAFKSKAESASFDTGDITFTRLTFDAHTVGVKVVVSRELLADSPNAAAIIERTLVDGLSQKIDEFGLVGTGSQELLGLKYIDGVNETSLGATPTFDDILTEIQQIEEAHGQPNAWVVSPEEKGVFDALKDTTGRYLSPPTGVAALRRFTTSALADEDVMFVGDFTKFLIGLRTDATVEITDSGGDAFSKHETHVKVFWRGDFNVAQAAHFSRITSLS